MHAALITAFDRPPRYSSVADDGDAEVLASAIHPRVRSQASGSHYTSDGALPLVPGVDGVARTADGAMRYFVTESGAMADRVDLGRAHSVELPDGIDPVRIAGAMNPVMSSWIALRRRVAFAPGQRVLVLGATGAAGRLAVQVAKHLGAAHVTAAARDAAKLDACRGLGADALVVLGRDGDGDALAAAGRDVDVVLDYLWGGVAAAALRAIVPARSDDEQALTWVAIGSTAGTESPIPSAALRATRLSIVGSGQGSVSPREILAELPGLAAEISSGAYATLTRAMPLTDVSEAWDLAATSPDRIVLVP